MLRQRSNSSGGHVGRRRDITVKLDPAKAGKNQASGTGSRVHSRRARHTKQRKEKRGKSVIVRKISHVVIGK